MEEEKKAQAQREKVLQEQAKKIKNLSSMVLLSNRDEERGHDQFKKVSPVFSIHLFFDTLRVYNSMASRLILLNYRLRNHRGKRVNILLV